MREPETPTASILIVDDEPANLMAMQAVLEPLGQRLVWAQSGEEALRHILQEDYAVVLMDVKMPGMDGFEAARLIRQRPQVLPVLFVTAFADTAEEMIRGYEAGAVDYIVKPLRPQIVQNKVSMFVELWRAREQLRLSLQRVEERDRHLAENQRESEARERFISILGHDLRTPLSVISMAASVLSENDISPEQRERASARIRRSTERMSRMIRDVLDFARGRLGGGIPIAPRDCDLGVLCQQSVDELRGAHPDRDVQLLQTGEDLRARADGDRAIQVIANLVGNALQHGQDPVRVTARAEPAAVVIEVENRGPPIPPELVSRLFEPFGKKERTRTSGLGLGLYIANGIVRAHGGVLQVRSGPEPQTTFTVRWPR